MKIGVFVDVGNIYYCVDKKFEGRKLDYRKYLEHCRELGEVHQMFAYGNQAKDEAPGFVHFLQQIGFNTRFFELATDKPKRRADWNCGITVDVANVIQRLDLVIVGSANPDLEPLANWVRSQGCNIIFFAAGISQRLKNNCTRFIEITEEILEELEA